MSNYRNPAYETEMPEVIQESFTFETDDKNDMPILGGVEVNFCYFMSAGKAVVSMSEVYSEPFVDNDEILKEAIDDYMRPKEVEYIR